MIHVETTDGKTVIVHSSVFDGVEIVEAAAVRIANATGPVGAWPDVWDRIDAERKPEPLFGPGEER